MDGEENIQPEETTEQTGEVNTILSLESMIKTTLASLNRLREDLQKHREMLDSIFENDETYQEHLAAAKEAARIKNATKQEILKQPQAADLNSKVKSMRSELKDAQSALSDYLSEYQRLSGVNEIEGEDGEVREIVYVAKLIRKPTSRR